MQIFRHESSDWILKITNRLLIKRNYAAKAGSLYEVLGLKRNATAVSNKNATKFFANSHHSLHFLFQNDIKNAYYSLSMIHHPDKNPNNQDAADKFREITEAYEVRIHSFAIIRHMNLTLTTNAHF